MNFKALKAMDLDNDLLKDIWLRKQRYQEMEDLGSSDNFLKGYIQEYSISPFFVSLYTNLQFQIFQKLHIMDPFWVVHIDSTGRMSAKLPEEYGTTQQYYYAAVVNLPGDTESPCIPLLEIVSNSHSATSLSQAFHQYFTR